MIYLEFPGRHGGYRARPAGANSGADSYLGSILVHWRAILQLAAEPSLETGPESAPLDDPIGADETEMT